jgi:glycosyltransferase involved in cell wall biosynthesis
MLTPSGPPTPRGNAITVERIARGLATRDVTAQVWDLSATAEADVRRSVVQARPRLVHAFHALRSGPLAAELARQLGVPYCVTLTGTDVNDDLLSADRAATVREVLTGAAAVTVFHASIRARVARALPELVARVVEIPQAVSFERRDRLDLAALWPLPPDRVLMLFPGGIRHVKNPLAAVRGLQPVAARHPRLRLALAGPVIETAEGEALQAALKARPWARYLGAVPHAQMAALMAAADVVINSSRSEGGMANAVLEALALGRAVLASDIEGNRSLIEPEVTGLLFGDEAELAAQAERLLTDGALRARLGAAGRALIERDYPPSREIDAYLALYSRLGLSDPHQ